MQLDLFIHCLSGVLPDEGQEEIEERSSVHGDIVEQLPQSDVRVVRCSVSSDRPGNPVPLVGKVPRKAGEEDPQAKEADSH